MKTRKRLLATLLCLCMAATLFPMTAFAVDGYHDGDVAVINAIIESNGLNWTKDDPENWPTNNAANAYVEWTGGRITQLYLYNQGLSGTMDVSGLESLGYLECSNNEELTGLTLTGLTNLTDLFCSDNSLTGLTLTGLTNLQTLSCADNNLTALDLSGLTGLQTLSCADNNLTALDVSDLTKLQGLYFGGNSLRTLENITGLAGLTSLTGLTCSDNNLTGTLDVTSLTSLTDLRCNDNSLTGLNLNGLTNLLLLQCYNNPLTSFTDKAGHTLTINVGTGGSVSITGYTPSTGNTELTATADQNYAFDSWTGGVTSAINPATFTLNSDMAVTANFRGTLAQISADKTELDFGSATEGYTPAAQTVTITNTGTKDVTLSISEVEKYYSVAVAPYTLPPNGTMDLAINPRSSLGVGNHDETITITPSEGASVTVDLKFTVDPTPTYIISADPSFLVFDSATEGYTQPAAQTVTVTNKGNQQVTLNAPTAETANYTIGALSTNTLAPNETATFTVQPKAGLAAGTHNDTITVTGSGGSSDTVEVKFTVVAEQFTLTPGGTYWFDLSGAGIPGTVNSALPDTDLNWVPFTYAGTINAYVLKADSSGNTTASETASKTSDSNTDVGYTYDHSLFVADYNVTTEVAWENDDGGATLRNSSHDFIFGESYASGGVSYTLRAPSAGSDWDGVEYMESERGTPHNNEWDAVLNKAGQVHDANDTGYIKNWRNIGSWGQDTYTGNASPRAVRGYYSARYWGNPGQSYRYAFVGFRPVLEVLNSGTLTPDGLKAVTVDLNGGSIGTVTGPVNLVVKSDTDFTAPPSDGLTRPDGNTGSYFAWRGDNGNTYNPGADVPASVTALTALWTAPAPSGGGTTYYTLTFDANGGSEIDPLRRSRGTTIDLSDYTPTREGWIFAGWYSDEELTDKITSVRLTGNTTIYAGWINAANPFTDVKETDWFFEDVMFVYRNGLMIGISDTLFDPYGTTTRAMTATVIWRMEGEPAPAISNPFTDVKNGEWYTNAILWAAQNDIAEGYGGGLFGTDDPVTREQLAAMFYRYAVYKGYDTTITGSLDRFTDADKVSDWAVDAMKWAVGYGLIQGKDNNILDPQGYATRAEFAAMLRRFIEKNELEEGITATGLMGWIDPKRTIGIPQTGDSTSSVGFAMLALPVAAGAAYCTRRLRRRKKDDGEPEPEPA